MNVGRCRTDAGWQATGSDAGEPMAVPERIGCRWVGRDVGEMSVEYESPSVVRQLVAPLVMSHWPPSTGDSIYHPSGG